jgi:hypothetical protein
MTKAKKVASLSIKAPGKMTKRGREDIAGWLRGLASRLEKKGDTLTDGRFTAGYSYF